MPSDIPLPQYSLSDTGRIKEKKNRSVAIWLLVGVAMIMVQVLLGGVTRLTGSGLSIAEWKPILGAVPPMNDHDWNAAFELYKTRASGQFYLQNSDFTLGNFKAIFFWEWMHREWGRLMGLVFAVGFVYFFAKKYFDQKMVKPFIVLFVLGGLQGAIGWIMVQSGLNEADTKVSHIRLAIHFIAALGLLCYVLWFALKLLVREERRLINAKLFNFTLGIIMLLTLQLIYGAFMAGSKAAPAAPTWPTINGSWTPGDASKYGVNTYTGIHQITDNPLVIHFIHRNLAYLIFILIVVWVVTAYKNTSNNTRVLLRQTAKYPAIFVIVQVSLGIYTVLVAPKMTFTRFGIFEITAETHQIVAMFLLMSLLVNLYVVKKKP